MPRPSDHPYADFLLDVEKPIRYLGGEYGSAQPTGGAAVALAFPDTYEIGMCFLGFHILYDVLRREEGIQVERAFAPWQDLEAELRKRGLPLVSLESRRPLKQFDVIGFSLQYELTFTNVLTMLDLGGIPLESERRSDADPIVIAGGPIAFQPEAMAPFIDAFVLGDGEEIIVQIVRTVKRFRDGGAPRRAILEELARMRGVYVPALVAVEEDPATGLLVAPPGLRIERVPAVDLERYPFPASIPVPDTEIVFDRYSIEIARGCNGGCRFCQGGFTYRPLRLRRARDIVETIRQGLRRCGFDCISLTSLSTADYPRLEDLVRFLAAELEPQAVTITLSSLRAYEIPDALLEALGAVRQVTLTFALEAGTQRLRNAINKNIAEEDILSTAERVFSRGWQRMKLYFMIGLPTETDEDVRGIIDVSRSLSGVARRFGSRAASGLTVSVSTFVPKPHTPFQWQAMLPEEEILRRQRLLYELARKGRISLKWHDAAMSIVECVMARADRRVSRAVLRAYELGCRFDGWADKLNYGAWKDAFRDSGVETERYLRAIPAGARLPWDHLASGTSAAFMREEHEKGVRAEATAPCFFDRVCHDCGARCDLPGPEGIPFELPAPPPPRRRPPDPVSFRIAFRRSGRLSYISQLDLVRIVPKVFRRADLAVGYSQGMRPRPLLCFSPALPLGATALRDLVDIKLACDLPGSEIVGRLAAVVPEGFEILSARQLGPWEKKLSRRVQALDCAVKIGEGASRSEIEAKVAGFLDADAAEVTIATKGEARKRVDLRALVYEARVVDALAAMGPDNGGGPFLFMRIKPEARPLAIASHVLGSTVPGTRLYRLDLVARGPFGFTPIT